MRAVRRVRCLAAAWAAIALCATPALAARGHRVPGRESLRATGAIVYTWHGDPSRGCATASLCQVSGALMIDRFEAPRLFGGLLTFSGGDTIRVSDGPSGGECVDGSAGPHSLEMQRGGRRRSLTFSPGSLSGRCAEPLGTELAALAIPIRLRGAHRHPTLDLRVSRRFTAGPFSGSLHSTLVMRSVRSSPGGRVPTGSHSSSSGVRTRSGHSPAVLAEFVDLRFRGHPVPSALDYGIAGAEDPACQILDSCGTSGSLSLAATGPNFTLALSAVRRVHHRVSSRRALTDFKRGRLAFDLPGFAELQTKTMERLTRSDGTVCQDSAGGRLQLTLGWLTGPRAKAGATLPVTLTSASQPAHVLRTHCPGPLDGDVIGPASSSVYAGGAVATRALLERRFRVSLTQGAQFSGLAYTGRPSGALTIQLTLVSAHAGTEGR